MDGRKIPGEHTSEYRIKDIDHTYNDKILKCEVSNRIGKTEDTETLNVHCKSTAILHTSVYHIIFLRSSYIYVKNFYNNLQMRPNG